MKNQFQVRLLSLFVILGILLSAPGVPMQNVMAAPDGEEPEVPLQSLDAANCNNPPNEIVAENCQTGNLASEWDVSGAGDLSIQGFATDISVNRGGTIQFKIDTTATAYDIKIYRLGYYNGNGARLVATIPSTVVTAIDQPACSLSPIEMGGGATTNGQLLDCGNWSVSASWQVPANATSGVYIARPTRTDNGGASHIPFIVRNDSSHSDLLFQTSDTTWQAYNPYGGYNAYGSSGAVMAEKLSYNRPFTLRSAELENYLFNAEYPMIRWLERNGYDVSYMSAIDIERYGDLIMNHKVYMSVGHDEYWSQGRRDAVTAARDAGVHLAFFSANEIYWKIRWEDSTQGETGTNAYRTRVNYKEGSTAPSGSSEHRNCYNNYNCDPSPIWTGQWREAPGSTPENSLSGQISWRLTTPGRTMTVPAEYAPLRFWRNTDVAALPPGGQVTLGGPLLGYEWDPEYAQYADWYPAGRVLLSSTDETSFAGPDTHHLSLYRAPSGALVFGAGTVQWSWGLDSNHDYGTSNEDRNVQQATVNLFADMGVQPTSLQTGLVAATASTDHTPPTVTVTSPASGASVPGGSVTISGTASDVGGVVGGVEISTNGGMTWRRATGRANWSYTYTATEGTADIRVRAADDSANLSAPITHNFDVQPRVCPCSLWDPASPAGPEDGDTRAIEVGVKFRTDVDGWVTGIRFYKHTTNIGTHIGNLWDTSGNNLGSVIFSGESSSGWQEATFAAPISVTANTTYIASYFGYGHYASSEGFFASSGLDNPPLRALRNGVDGPNGVYIYSASSAFPNQEWNSSNYWVDLVFATEVGPDNTPPQVSSTTPANNATGVSLSTTVTATFNEAMNAATITADNFELRDGAGALIPATVVYNAATRKATLTPNSALTASTSYTATIMGGANGVADVSNNKLAANFVWSFVTSAPPPLPPDEGPGGPILVVADSSNTANPFGRYYAEILRAEGFNAYYVMDISNVTPATLTTYDVVLLGEMPLTAGQVTMFDDWVAGGGNLIAFRPAKALASLYGLTDAGNTTSEGYLAVNTATSIGRGVVPDTLQFHGTADYYTLSGATSLGTLYNTATTPTAYPAIVRYGRGSGQVVIFTFDLARSIILMRQGNPAWAGQEGDGVTGIRASDMFVGRSGQPNWIDNNKLLIPQADEQMHVLSHAIEQLNAAKSPLPRLWYFPNNIKGALIMTGDTEGCGWACTNTVVQHVQSYGGTYSAYMLYTSESTLAQYNAAQAAGHELAVHYDNTANANNPTVDNMTAVYDARTQAQITTYGSGPRTVRNHWIVWTGWSEQAEIEAAHGIGLDTNYYHWGSWLSGPGYFTGSGLPMRFSDENGAILNIFQSTTQLPDETWGQNIYNTFKTLIDRSIDQGYYGFLNANFHPPSYGSYQTVAGNMMSYANTRGVPIWSAEKLLDFLQARNQARIQNQSWNGTQLSFDFNALTPYNGLTLMIPAQAGGNNLLSLTKGGTPVSFNIETIKGYDYALFVAGNGSYVATYDADTTPPTITSHTPLSNATNVAINANVTATFSEEMNPATINTSTFRLRADDAVSDVIAAVTYDEASKTATLNPITDLAYSKLYHVTVSGTVQDASLNPMGNSVIWDFTTQAEPPPSVTDTTVADFTAGTLNACIADADIGDGAVRLSAALDESFSGPDFPSAWTRAVWSGGTLPQVSGGSLVLDGGWAHTTAVNGASQTLEFTATFNAAIHQHIGFLADPTFNQGPWILFSTGPGGTQLYARITPTSGGPYNTGDDAIGLGSQYLGAPHLYKIVWNANSIDFFIDGTLVASRDVTIATPMFVAASDLYGTSPALNVDWLRLLPPYNSPCTFTSRVFDAGGTVAWETLSWTGTTPAGTSLGLSYRNGDTPIPDGAWTNFTTVPTSGAALGGNSRYIQYRANLSTTDTGQTPVLEDVIITHTTAGPDTTPPTVTGRTPTPNALDVALNTNVTVTFNEAMKATSLGNSTFSLLAEGSGSPVSATVTYDAASRTATLNPTSDLAYSTLYHVTVSGSVTDLAGNPLGSDTTWSFTTESAPLPVLTDTTVADFTSGTLDACVVDATIGDGAIRLGATIDENFPGANLPGGWSSKPWPSGGTSTVSGGLLTVDGAVARNDTLFNPGRTLEFMTTFKAEQYEHIGFAGGTNTYDEAPIVMFSTRGTTNTLFTSVWLGGSFMDFAIPNSGSWIGAPHQYRIDWKANGFDFYVDGSLVDSRADVIAGQMRVAASDYNKNDAGLTVDWVKMSPYASPCAFTSRVFDAGGTATWKTLSWTGTTPTGTGLALGYRIGDTPNPDASWTSFATVPTSGAALSGSSRYIQYQAGLSASDTNQTPLLQDVTIAHTDALPDTTSPTVTGRTPTPDAINVAPTANITVTFSEAMNAGTITASAFNLWADGAGSDVDAVVMYDAATKTAILNPTADLAYSTLYHVAVSGSVTDLAGNPLGSDATWNFTTEAAPLPVLADSTVADFSAGTLNSCVADATIGDGAVRLPLVIDEAFSGTTLPGGWTSTIWTGSTPPTIGGGMLSVNGSEAYTTANYSSGHSLEFVATFSAHAYQTVGFAGGNPPLNTPPWLQFGTGSTGTQLYARILPTGGSIGSPDDAIALGAQYLGSPHTYRIDWSTDKVEFFIDGVSVLARNMTFAESMHVVVSDYTSDAYSVPVDWIKLTPYASPCTFTSRVFDAGQPVNWDTISWTGNVPTGASLGLSYRIGNTPTLSGVQWVSLSGNSPQALAGNAQYIQYQAELSSSDTTLTPDLRDVTFAYHTGADTTAPVISNINAVPVGNTNAVITWNTDEPSDSLVQYGTTPGSLGLSESSAAFVTGHTIALSGLTADTTYYYRVTSKDAADNSATSPVIGNAPASFTTPPVIYTTSDTAAVDFNAGSGSCPVDTTIGDGALRLPLTIDEGFSGTSLPTGWTSTPWTGGTSTVSGGIVTVSGARLTPTSTTGWAPTATVPVVVEFVATFGAAQYQNAGLGAGNNSIVAGGMYATGDQPWAMFGIPTTTTNQLYARLNPGGDVAIGSPGAYTGSPHRYRIEWRTGNVVEFFIDGVSVNSRTATFGAITMRPGISDYQVASPSLTVDWLKLTPYVSPCAFTSRVIDAGQLVHWTDLSATGSTPAGTSVNFETHTGNTAIPDGTWSSWQAVNSPIASPNGRYIQYRATLGTTNSAQTPVVESVALSYKTLTTPTITWDNPADIPYGTPLSAIQLNATTSAQGTFTYSPDAGTILNTGSHTLHVDFTPTDTTRYTSASKDVTIHVTKANATVTLNGLSQTYDGAPKPVTVTTVPDGLTVDITYDGSTTAPTNAGSYTVSATINDPNYSGTTKGTLTVAKADATVTLAGLTGTYDGAPKPVTVTTNPSGLTVNITYDSSSVAPTDAGSYAVSAAVDDVNYAGTANETLEIAKAGSSTTVSGGGSFVYDGNPHAATVNVTGAGNLNLSPAPVYSGACSAAPVNVTDTPCTASYTYAGDANHEGSTGSTSITITPASATVTLDNLTQTYTGTPRSVKVTTVPAGLTVDVTYDGSPTAPTALGNYAVVATVNNPNYTGSAADTLVIEQASATHSVSLVPGWNLVSFNVHPADTTVASVLASLSGNYDLVYAWDASGAHSSGGNWMKYAPAAPAYANSLTNLNETMGFWIHMTAADTLDVNGIVPVTTSVSLWTNAGGWNLVAYPASVNRALPAAFSDNGAGTDFSLVYAYHANEATDPWKLFARTAPVWANDLTELAPGWGYWVKVSANHTWSVQYLAGQ